VSESVYRLRSSAVISEIIDGEAIIMDMGSGSYFSTAGIGADIWQLVAGNAGRSTILDAAEAAFPATPGVRQDAATFLDEIEAAGLVVQQSQAGTGPLAHAAFGDVYVRPALLRHDDLKDLIELDPIHEVGATGWPVRKQTA
jgi:hypothetical protein